MKQNSARINREQAVCRASSFKEKSWLIKNNYEK